MNGTKAQRRRRAGWFGVAVAAFIGVEATVAFTRHQSFWGPVLTVVAIGCLCFGLRDIVISRRR